MENPRLCDCPSCGRFFYVAHLFHNVSVSARILGMCLTALWPFVITRYVPCSLGQPAQSRNPPPVGTECKLLPATISFRTSFAVARELRAAHFVTNIVPKFCDIAESFSDAIGPHAEVSKEKIPTSTRASSSPSSTSSPHPRHWAVMVKVTATSSVRSRPLVTLHTASVAPHEIH